MVCVCNLSTSRIPNDRPMIELFVGTVGESMLSWLGLLLCNFVKPTLFCLLQAAMATRLEHQWSVDLGHPHANVHPGPRGFRGSPRTCLENEAIEHHGRDHQQQVQKPESEKPRAMLATPPAIPVTPTRYGPIGGCEAWEQIKCWIQIPKLTGAW